MTTLAGQFDTRGSRDGPIDQASFYQPGHAIVDATGTIYVTDQTSLRRIAATGAVTTLATGFWSPSGVALDGVGGFLVADSGYSRICRVTAAGVVTTFAGTKGTRGSTDGVGENALFGEPTGLVVDAAGVVYVADAGNYRIRKITPDGTVTTLAGSSYGFADGTGSAAQFAYPLSHLTLDGAGGLYVADGSRIRHVTQAGVVTTVAGSTIAGSQDGAALVAQFSSVRGLAMVGAGLLIADTSTFRRLENGQVTTIAGRAAQRGRIDGTAGSCTAGLANQVVHQRWRLIDC